MRWIKNEGLILIALAALISVAATAPFARRHRGNVVHWVAYPMVEWTGTDEVNSTICGIGTDRIGRVLPDLSYSHINCLPDGIRIEKDGNTYILGLGWK